MQKINFIYWQETDFWVGYLQDYPDYRSQGDSLDDLMDHLRDLYQDLSGGHIPGARMVGELALP